MQVIELNSENPILANIICLTAPVERLVGLIGRNSIPTEHGFYFPRCRSIHTCFMRFKIDIIYINKKKEVVKVVRNMKPWRFSACGGAAGVIEVSAGHITKYNIAEGMQLQFVENGGNNEIGF